MKTKLTMLVGVAALGLCVAGVQAQDEKGPDKKKRPDGPPSKEQIMKRFDKDGDGALSKEELAAMPERMRTRMLEKWDKDGDEALSKEEVEKIEFPKHEPGKGGGKKGGKKGKDGGAGE